MSWLLQALLFSLSKIALDNCIREMAISTVEVTVYWVPIMCQSQQPWKAGIIIRIHQARELKLNKVKKLVQNVTDSKCQHQDLNLKCL